MKIEKLSKQEVDVSLFNNNVVIFQKEIDELQVGEALKFKKEDWLIKTPPHIYYIQSKKMKNIVSIKAKGDFYFIIKL